MVQWIVFGKVANFASHFEIIFNRVHAGDPNGTARCGHETGNNPHRGGLARAVWTEKTENFAFLDVERKVFNGMNVAELFVKAFYFEHYGIVR